MSAARSRSISSASAASRISSRSLVRTIPSAAISRTASSSAVSRSAGVGRRSFRPRSRASAPSAATPCSMRESSAVSASPARRRSVSPSTLVAKCARSSSLKSPSACAASSIASMMASSFVSSTSASLDMGATLAKNARWCQGVRGAAARKLASARAFGTSVSSSTCSSSVWNPLPRGPSASIDATPSALVVDASLPPPWSGDSA